MKQTKVMNYICPYCNSKHRNMFETISNFYDCMNCHKGFKLSEVSFNLGLKEENEK